MSVSIQSLTHAPAQLLRRAHQLATAIALEELAEFNLTPIQFGLLIVLNERPGIDAKTLCSTLSLDRASLTGVLDRMEASGLVTREMDPNDRRARVLALTPKGRDVFRQSSRKGVGTQLTILDPLSPKEQASFMKLLAKLVEAQTRRLSRPSSSGS
ncbi:MarR family winged helix-turn-helix transcriptional regulator [Hydrogenophaga sp.]|uniref:MarR family winged helix-turn-helix transcriptional regulator n=1 Tax=Hydrogenophaga sp. TaxID=1904254 RepID=UPI00262F80F3|nr:MarR family winged helix-turn-helix transcriptional regulator [Hydrogenophaga sp.]MCW5652752.1 winged helix-turn-helix transcriptional regulator [Hydrogenophaga sp.]